MKQTCFGVVPDTFFEIAVQFLFDSKENSLEATNGFNIKSRAAG